MPIVKVATGQLLWESYFNTQIQPKREFQIMIFLYRNRPNSEHIILGDLKYTEEEI